jgi:hypothetical protein
MSKIYAIGMTALVVANSGMSNYQIVGAIGLAAVILIICKWIQNKHKEGVL